ncbi:RING finger protein 17-like [Lineus longissimus]|uniref:RING finger protein 17-like n=1 Tax=Lineus longissimus TaxID=88925 RepID=UPI002B4E9B6A
MNMNKALHCRSCNQIFSGKDVNQQHGLKTPLLLKCAHTICESCARKIVKIQKTLVTCPTCQEATPVKNGDVKTLPPDVYIMGLSMIKKTSMDQATMLKLKAAGVVVAPKKTPSSSSGGASGGRGDGIVRELCGECCSNEATVACLKCECNMCGQCFDKIHQAKILRSHRAIAFNQSESCSGGTTCSVHDNREYEYYCEDDKVSVCSRCVIAGKHKDHQISPLEEKNKGVLAELDPAIQVATNVVKKMKASVKTIDAKFPDIKADLEKKMASVNLHFHAMHSQLQQREINLINELQVTYSKVTEPLHEMKAFLEEQQQRFDGLIKDARRLHNSQQAAMNGRGILDQLQEAQQTDCIIKTPDTKELDIWCKFSEQLRGEITSHGEIVCEEKPIGYIIEALDEVDDLETPSESSDQESLPGQLKLLKALSMSSCTSGPSSTTSDDVIIEDSISVSLSGPKSGANSMMGSSDNMSSKSLDPESEPETRKPMMGKQLLESYHSEVVVVTHIRHPCHFTVQVHSNDKKLKALSHNINRWCSSVEPNKYIPIDVEPDDLLLAQFTKDDKWYRARVKKCDIDTSGDIPVTQVEVLYVDFGNMETIPKTRLRKMQKKFLKEPEFGILCTLVDIVPPNMSSQWSEESITTFARMTGDTNMLMTVHNHSHGFLYVDLCKPPYEEVADDRPISVRDALVFLELAVFFSPQSVVVPHTRIYPAERQFLSPELPRVGDDIPSYVCHVNDPCDFFIQSLGGDDVSYLVTMMNELQKVYNMDKGELWTIFCPRIGMICIAKHSTDGLWNRARVIGIPGGKMVTVQYVDYGNIECINIWKLKKILDPFLLLPAQAIHCKLTDIRPHDNEWEPEVVQSFIHMTHNVVIHMKVTRISKDCLNVIAFDSTEGTEICINAELVRANLAISIGPCSKPQKVNPVIAMQQKITPSKAEKLDTPPASESGHARPVSKSASLTSVIASDSETDLAFFPVIISNVISPFEIYLQTTTAMEDGLAKLMKELNEMYKDSEANIVKWEKGDYCAVIYSEDNKWYRGRILKVDDEMTDVHILDFGYKERTSINNLRVMEESLLEQPCFSLKCFVDDIQPAGDPHKWSATAVEYLREVLPRGKLCQVAKNGDIVDGSLPVTLLNEMETEADALNAASIMNVSISKILKERGVALPIRRKPKTKNPSPAVPMSPPKAKPKRRMEENLRVSYLAPLPPSTPVLPVVPTYVNYDCVIFVQRTDDVEDTLTDLMDQLQEEFADTLPEDDVLWETGMSVTARFSDDMMWYRAEIVEIDARGIKVIYSDFGNSEYVPPERLRTKLMFTDIPLQCYECELKGIVTASGDNVWPVSHLNYLHNMIVSKQCIVTIKEQPVYGSRLQISLTIDDVDLGTHLCNFGYALNLEPEPLVIIEDTSESTLVEDELSVIPDPCPSRGPKSASWSDIVEQEQAATKGNISPYKQLELPARGEYFSLTVTNLVSPSEIYGQFTRQETDENPRAVEINRQLETLVVMVYEINQMAHAFHLLKDPARGMACCCQYTYDQQWYRAEIRDICGDGCTVHYVDYGNGESQPLSSLRSLPEKFMELPAMAFNCVLDGVELPVGEIEWSVEAMQRMSECLSTVPAAVACLKSDWPLAIVDLYADIPIRGEPAPLIYQDLIQRGIIRMV